MMALFAVITSTSFAQLVTSSRVSVQRSESKPGLVWVDFGAGGFTGDVYDSGLGVDLGIRVTKMFTSSIGWDIFKISAQTDTKNFSESLELQAKTGIRYVSPVFFGNNGSVYGNVSLGYGYFTDMEKSAFVWEVGAGFNLTSRFSIGGVYNSSHVKGGTVGYAGVRFGYRF